MCSTRVVASPVRRSLPSMFSMQPRSPSTTAPAPLARMFSHFSSTIAVEMLPYLSANVPPKPQQCSQPCTAVVIGDRCGELPARQFDLGHVHEEIGELINPCAHALVAPQELGI